MRKKTKLTRSLTAACSVVALSVVMYGCGGSGHSDADLEAAEERARLAAEAAAAEAARQAAAEAERERQAAVAAAVAEAERKAAEAAAAAEKMARAAAQKATLAEAVTAAQSAVAMVTLGASDADITAAEAAIQAITDAIAAAVDVDDTSMYSAQATLLNGSLATATSLVHQDRAAKKMARADAQKGAIANAIEEAKTAVAAIDDATTPEAIAAAAMTAGEKVQAAKDAIAAAVDVDDTSMYTATVDGLETSVGTSATMARSAYQSGKVMAALGTAGTLVNGIKLGATDEMIAAANAAIGAAKAAIAAAVDVDDTSMYTARLTAIESTMSQTILLVMQDRETNRMARAETQKGAINNAIADAQAAVALVVDGASDEVIEAAETAIQDARDAIADAADVDDTSMYTTTVNGLATGLAATKITVLANRAAQGALDTQIASARSDATEAMNAAKTAADNAKMAADAADEARMNIATMQTNEKSGMYAMNAREHANMAMGAYEDAKAASEAADAAETVAAAVEARVDAEAAQKIAMEQETMAGADKDSATGAVPGELFIDGTEKTVGGTTIDATAVSRTEIENGYHTITGLLDDAMQPDHTVDAVMGQAFAVDDPGTTGTDEAMPYRQAVAERTFTIGKTLDSSDDTARLMLVTSYAGTKTVKVYADRTDQTDITTTRLNRVAQGDGVDNTAGNEDDPLVTLTKVGTFYKATPGDTDTTANALDADDVIGADAKGVTVYTYTYLGADDAVGGGDDETRYVVEDMAVRETVNVGDDAVTTYTYQLVDIMAVSLPDGDDTDTALDEGRVTAKVPEASEYKHIHFGVWAGLSAAAKNGSQDIAGLGIGFVQNHDGSGETGNMPLQGDATYEGDWVATIQEADEDGDGAINLHHGPATIMANFEDDEIEIDLVNLAMLKGDLTLGDSAFSGDADATDISGMYGLSASGDFEGSFSGAFYGSKAAEVGGIFDYSSDDMEDGAFRGAFGADKK